MGKINRASRVLYFIDGPTPSKEDEAAALELAGQGKDVVFRNLRWVKPEEAVEAFDDVAGKVPKNYLDAKAERESKAARDEAAGKFAAFDRDGDGSPGGAPKGGNRGKGGRTAAKPEEPPAPDPAAESAKAALQRQEAPPATPPAPPAVEGATGPAAASGDLTQGWGGAPPPPDGQQTGGPSPEWKPNA